MNIFYPVKYDFNENIWFNLSAFFVYNWPPPLVKHAKGMFCYFILCKADKVVDMGVLPRTKTPSMSVIKTGLNSLCFRFLKWLCNAVNLLIEERFFIFFIIWPKVYFYKIVT